MNLCDIEPSRMTGRELLSEHRRLRCKIEKQGERYKGHVEDWLRLSALRRRIDEFVFAALVAAILRLNAPK